MNTASNFLVEGYHKTKNINRYMFRLACFTIVSYIPAIIFMFGEMPSADTKFLYFNIGLTLLLGLCLLRVQHEIKNKPIKYILTGIIFLLADFGDWGSQALLVVLIFDFYYKNYKNQAFAYSMLILGSGALYGLTASKTYLSFPNIFVIKEYAYNIITLLGSLFPMWLLKLYNGEKGCDDFWAKWMFYIIYPLHLLILGIFNLFN